MPEKNHIGIESHKTQQRARHWRNAFPLRTIGVQENVKLSLPLTPSACLTAYKALQRIYNRAETPLSTVYPSCLQCVYSHLSFLLTLLLRLLLLLSPLCNSPSRPRCQPSESVSCFGWCVITRGFFHRDEADENTARRPSELLTVWKWMSQREQKKEREAKRPTCFHRYTDPWAAIGPSEAWRMVSDLGNWQHIWMISYFDKRLTWR